MPFPFSAAFHVHCELRGAPVQQLHFGEQGHVQRPEMDVRLPHSCPLQPNPRSVDAHSLLVLLGPASSNIANIVQLVKGWPGLYMGFLYTYIYAL